MQYMGAIIIIIISYTLGRFLPWDSASTYTLDDFQQALTAPQAQLEQVEII